VTVEQLPTMGCRLAETAFAEIFRVLRRDSFCVSFYGWHQADKFIAAWREAGFRLAGHLTHEAIPLNGAVSAVPQ
jgi:hypothetical protein